MAGSASSSVNGSDCCPQVIGDGCWADGTNTGRWVSVRNEDGTVELFDHLTGNTVAPTSVVDCPAPDYRSTLLTVGANTAQTVNVPTLGLVSWSVRHRSGTVTVTVNGGAGQQLDPGEVVASSTQDDTGVLEDAVTVATTANSSARVAYTQRV